MTACTGAFWTCPCRSASSSPPSSACEEKKGKKQSQGMKTFQSCCYFRGLLCCLCGQQDCGAHGSRSTRLSCIGGCSPAPGHVQTAYPAAQQLFASVVCMCAWG